MKHYQVGELEVLVDHREIRRGGEPLALRPMSFDLLVYLISHHDRLLTREELLEQIWKGTSVSENSLTQCVKELRRVMNDDAREPRFIKTVAKSGYRFVGPVEEIAGAEGISSAEGVSSNDAVPVAAAFSQPLASKLYSGNGRWWIAAAMVAATGFILATAGARGTSAKQTATVPIGSDNLEAVHYYTLGVQKAHDLHSEEAVKLFEKAIELDPAFAMAHARLGYAHSIAGVKTEEGRKHLERAFQLSTRMRSVDRQYVAAWYAQATQDYEAAIKTYRDLIAQYPEEIEARQLLATLFIGEERFDEARTVLQAALKVDPASPQTYNLLSNLNLETNRFNEALEAAQRFAVLEPKEANARDSLGLAYEAHGDFKEAEDAYRSALQLEPGFQIPRLHLANTLLRMGRYREALKEFEIHTKSSALISEQRRGWDGMAAVHRLKGDIAGARALADHDPSGEVRLLLALDRGELKLADEILAQRPQGNDRGKRASQRFLLYFNGKRAMARGNTVQALAYFRQTLETRTPFFALSWYEDCLGDALLKAGRADEAAIEYQRVLARYPKLALVWFHLGEAYRTQGMTGPARDATQRFLDLWKDADRDIPEVMAARKMVGES